MPQNQTKMANTCAVRRLNQILSTREIKIKAKNSTRLEKMAQNGVKVAKKVIKMSNSQALNNVEDLQQELDVFEEHDYEKMRAKV